MLAWLEKRTLNQKLALVALLLGAIATLARVGPDRSVSVNEKALLTAVERRDDHVTPSELAGWIIEGRSDYRLLDLRDPEAYARYHIPTAENVPLPELPEAILARNERIVLYSEGGLHAAQAWMLLRARGYPGASTILGGLDAWKDEVLFPVLPEGSTATEKARFEREAAVARFFGGLPRSGDAALASASAPELPKVEVPPPTPAGAGAARPRKRREGC